MRDKYHHTQEELCERLEQILHEVERLEPNTPYSSRNAAIREHLGHLACTLEDVIDDIRYEEDDDTDDNGNPIVDTYAIPLEAVAFAIGNNQHTFPSP